MRVYATKYLVESDHNYNPGDEIRAGQLYDQARYYEGVGCVRVEVDPEPEPVAEPDELPAIDLSEMTVTELRAMAEDLGLEGYWKLRKADLIEVLHAHRNAG